MAGAGVRLPVLRLGAQGLLAVQEVTVPLGTATATLGTGAGALVLMSAPPPLDPNAARALYEQRMQEARKAFPHLAGGSKQKHHLHPRYLGGLDNGPTVLLDPAYHQLITNAFRQHHGYGRGALNLTQALKLMRLIYSKYPLPGVHF